ncbi:LOW QUALITY PROTEIN: formin-like protein 8 [Aristolochia californica]|uniref:LOW QUALITY PROTEIN: formin-like protein 8 n=1 Tax=Aristolochia californica TaxID=171875 RepID=UPI0035DA8A2D
MKASGFSILVFFFLVRFVLVAPRPPVQNSADSLNRRILHQPLFPLDSTPPPAPPEPVDPEDPPSDWPFFPQAPPGGTPTTTQSTPPPANASASPSRLSSQTANALAKTITIAASISVAALVVLTGLAFLLYRHRIKRPEEAGKLFGINSRGFTSEGPTNASEILYLGTMEPSNRRQEEVNRSPSRKLNSIRRAELHRPSPELQPMPPLNEDIKRLPFPVISSEEDTSYYSPNCSSVTLTSEGPRSPETKEESTSTTTSTKGVTHKRSYSARSCRTSPKSRLSSCSNDTKETIQPPQSPVPPVITTPPPPPPPPITAGLPAQDGQPKTPSAGPRMEKFSDPPSQTEDLVLPTSTNDLPLRPVEGPSLRPPPAPIPIPKVSSSTQLPPPLLDLGKHSSTTPPPSPPPPPPPPPLPLPFPLPHRPTETSVTPVPGKLPPGRIHMLKPSPTQAKQDKLPTPEMEDNNGRSSLDPLEAGVNSDETKPKLKPLHWDKVRATSDRATVWDHLKSSSFQLNEDMIQTLFVSNSMNSMQTEATGRPNLPPNQENRVLDPKKSQNIAILLRALNVTREEVTEALLDGNPEGLGAELFETLVKMAPTKEEELKLRAYSGEISKLGSAERFLKAVLDIPFAFKRVDAMLYRSNFDTEVNYLRRSFETLEVACEELKNSRLFLKLLEAVLRTGNRMNVGTYRGEAKAFKLDTLLKLVDVKGTDGKTTLLHFVVQEIIRSESSGPENNVEGQKQPQPKLKVDEFKKQGLQVVAGLGRELGNVKKAAGMDSDVLNSYVSKLEMGLDKIKVFLSQVRLSSQGRFFEAMGSFVKAAEDEILKVKGEESKTLHHVKAITEYFHGDAAKEEAHPFRIFMVVRDFLAVLDQVCKEVGSLHEHAMVGAAKSFQISASASLPVLDKYSKKLEESSDEDTLSP